MGTPISPTRSDEVLIDACLRGNSGGSPTVVLPADDFLSDASRSAVPERFGTSHAVFVQGNQLRFFTSAGELPACGHGTVAALAYLARTTGQTKFQLHASGRSFFGRADPDGDRIHAAFDPGPVSFRTPSTSSAALVGAALGVASPGACVIATLGRPRILMPVPSIAELTPDFDRLRETCDGLGLLGCYAYTPPTSTGHATARMFAPSIGVPEDIANANSTACLAAHLSADITVDMGDVLGRPSTITASPRPRLTVGGFAACSMITRR